MLPLLLPGCGTEVLPAKDDRWLTPVEHLVRASIAVRGVRPSEGELDAVEADPAALEDLLDAWLGSPEFGATVRDLHAETLLVRADTLQQYASKGALEGLDQATIHASTSEEPLKLVERIVLEDRPYTEVVTADWMLADEVLAKVYGVPWDPAGPEWQESAWTDGRPAAGLLTSSELYHRHPSNGSNFHRGRANLIASAFLCDDIGARDISLEGAPVATDVDEVVDALATETACGGCHQALEPIASFLWGFWAVVPPKSMTMFLETDCEGIDFDELEFLPPGVGFPQDLCYPLRLYRPETEETWAEVGLPPPALYGRPGRRLDDLGRLIAEDPRFATCTARRFEGYLLQRDPLAVEPARAAELARVLVDSGWSAKELVRTIVLSDAMRTRAGDGNDPATGLLTVRPEQYARTVEALTGYRWLLSTEPPCDGTCWGTVDLATSDVFGTRALQGGIDSVNRVRPTHTPTPTKHLAMVRMAAEAADAVVEADLAEPDPARRRLLREVRGDATDGARETLAALHRRILSETVDPDGPVVDADLALFEDALARHGAAAPAWKLVVTALLTDPRMVTF